MNQDGTTLPLKEEERLVWIWLLIYCKNFGAYLYTPEWEFRLDEILVGKTDSALPTWGSVLST